MSEAQSEATMIRVGRWWLSLEDGWVGPVVSGGSDAGPGNDAGGAADTGAAPPPPAPDAPADAGASGAQGDDPAGASGGAPAGSEPPPWEGKTPQDLWEMAQSAIKDRDQAKERYRPLEQTLSNLHPDDAQFFTDFITVTAAAGRGDTEASDHLAKLAPVMRGLLDKLSPAQAKAVAEAVGDAAAGDAEFDPYDAKQVEALAERKARELIDAQNASNEQARKVEEARVSMRARASELAATHDVPELGDPESPLGRLLYITAQHQFGDEADTLTRLDKAAQAIVDSMGEAAQKLLKAKTADTGPGPAPVDSDAPSGQKRPNTWDEADRAAKARLEARARGVTG